MKTRSFSDLRHLLPESGESLPPRTTSGHDGKGQKVRISIDTKGRKGKTVTIIEGLRHNPAMMEALAAMLKKQCGTGGTVKEGHIELQGDQREKAGAEMARMNYIVQ